MEILKFYNSFKLNFSEKDIIKYYDNEYLLTDNDNIFKIRNFCQFNGKCFDIDEYYDENDLKTINFNITNNKTSLNASLNTSRYKNDICFLFGDGNNWENIDENLFDFNCLKIGTNRILSKYANKINLYLNNNPFDDCINCIPKNIIDFPNGIFPYKINYKFLKAYRGTKYGYNTPNMLNDNGYINLFQHHINLEDHRNPYLAILSLFGIINPKLVVLICCENSLKEQMPGTIYIKENMYMYPHQIINLSILSAGAYWLNNNGIKVVFLDSNIDFIRHISCWNLKQINRYINGEI